MSIYHIQRGKQPSVGICVLQKREHQRVPQNISGHGVVSLMQSSVVVARCRDCSCVQHNARIVMPKIILLVLKITTLAGINSPLLLEQRFVT